jgi:hypothetical protein
MSRAQYESSIEGLEAARAAALATLEAAPESKGALEAAPESKGALEEVAAYSELIGKAKCELAELPAPPAKPPTGIIKIAYLTYGDGTYGSAKWEASLFDVATGAPVVNDALYGTLVSVARLAAGEEHTPRVECRGCPDAKYVVSGGCMYAVGGDLAYDFGDDEGYIDEARCGSINVLNTDTWEWDTVAEVPFEGILTCAAAMDGRIYMGAEGELCVHIWDTATRKWSAMVADAGVARHVENMFRIADAIVTANTHEIGIIMEGHWKRTASFELPGGSGFRWSYVPLPAAPPAPQV